MICVFCSAHLDSQDEAIEAGWWPSFWAGETDYEGPVCGDCTAKVLVMSEDGEMVLRAGVPVPELARPLKHRKND